MTQVASAGSCSSGDAGFAVTAKPSVITGSSRDIARACSSASEAHNVTASPISAPNWSRSVRGRPLANVTRAIETVMSGEGLKVVLEP